MRLQRDPLRKQVRDAVLAEIMSGGIGADTKLNEGKLAAALGISRTPLREGLVLLQAEGVVASHPNRGFYVPRVSKKKVVEIYSLIGPLEALAIRQSAGGHKELAAVLKAVNAKLRRETRQRTRQGTLDALWHETLLSRCGNGTLIDTVERLRSQAVLFDGAAARGMASHLPSCDAHDTIADLIGEGDLEAAGRAAEAHWLAGIEVVCAWIDRTCPDVSEGETQ